MNASLSARLALIGVNVGFVNDCIASGRYTEEQAQDWLLHIVPGRDAQKVHAFNREIWRLRNLRLRKFDAKSFAPDVLQGLGFDVAVFDKAVQANKATTDNVAAAVVRVCRYQETVSEVHVHFSVTDAEPVDEDAIINLGFDMGVLDMCCRSRRVTWEMIDAQIAKVRSGRKTVEDVETGLVEKACQGLKFPRACKLRERLVRHLATSGRRAA